MQTLMLQINLYSGRHMSAFFFFSFLFSTVKVFMDKPVNTRQSYFSVFSVFILHIEGGGKLIVFGALLGPASVFHNVKTK